MKLEVPSYDLRKRGAEATYGVLVEILLKSRVAMALDTNADFYDEDVNAYLAGVLFGYLDPERQEAIRPCLAARDTDVFWQATREEGTYHTYWVYKVNADDRLVDLGIFHPQQARSDAVLAQAQVYYGLAADLNHRWHRRTTAVSEILDKLSHWTARYVAILHQARRDYLRIVETMPSDELREFQQGLERDRRTMPLRAKQDEFLDVYAAWQRTDTPELKTRLLALLAELRQMDPAFQGPRFINALTPSTRNS
ncbi:MAG: hypothetical protein A3C53_03820 [Omnitrophica WOR_2 bacterium RIFCSPHIGHO2_02_FULL_68_15]|nr:MAG: hypothetical protein A3C53_03820 [Omnitrophica WOR_2 bacterium RIFCSPHIGHO2_02_FULL_68_15]